MGGEDLSCIVECLGWAAPRPRLSRAELERLFVEPRCRGTWLPRDVPDSLIAEAWHLARMSPTSANGSALRLVLLRGEAEKEPLPPMLHRGNQEKSYQAPVVAILADIGPMSGFDDAAVQAAYFAGTSFEVNFICNIGYGASADLMPRLPRLALEEIVHRPAMRR